MRTIVCELCGDEVAATGNGQKYCKPCAPRARRIREGTGRPRFIVCARCGDEVVATGNAQKWCRPCSVVVTKDRTRWKSSAPHAKRAAERALRVRRHCGTVDRGRTIWRAQGGRCAICDVPFEWTSERWNFAFDHDHAVSRQETPRAFRGFLCRRCNQGLGHFADDPVRLERAVAYLKEPPASRFPLIEEAS